MILRLYLLCALVFAFAAATLNLNGMNIAKDGGVAARWTMINNHVLEDNFALMNPPTATRYITMLDIAMYDAASYFHDSWLPLIAVNIAPRDRCNNENRARKCVSYAAHHLLNMNWNKPSFVNLTRFAEVADYMSELNYPAEGDNSNAANIGIAVAEAVYNWFLTGGTNANGTDYSSVGGVFSDTTNYFSANDVPPVANKIDCSALRAPGHWVPLRVSSSRWGEPAGGSYMQSFSAGGVQASQWTPIALKSANEIRVPAPPQYGTPSENDFYAAYEEVQRIFSNHSDFHKVVAEYWNERMEISMGGPMGRMQEWACIFAQEYSMNVFEQVQILVLQGVAMYDSAIAAWHVKRLYDHPRPISVVQCRFHNQTIKSWLGPYKGVGDMKGEDWFPYQSWHDSNPPFPGYVSGHATFSAATAEVFRLWRNGNDTLDWSFTFKEGTSVMEPKRVAGEPGYIAGVTDVPNQGPNSVGYTPATDITLHWKTFAEAAVQCGQGRMYAGVHITADGTAGNTLGEGIAGKVFERLGCAFRGDRKCAPKLV